MSELETIACISRVVLLGDQKAFEKLVRAYEQPLRAFLLQQTQGDTDLTDDLAQETFIRVWQQLKTFKRASQFKTWLFSIAYHLYMDDCRYRQARPMVDIALLCDGGTGQSDLATETDAHLIDSGLDEDEHTEREEWVHRAMDQLPEPARTILTLSLMQDMTSREISRIVNLSENNVRQIIFRYRPKLKQLLIDTRDK